MNLYHCAALTPFGPLGDYYLAATRAGAECLFYNQHGLWPHTTKLERKQEMNPTEFLLSYLLGGLAAGIAGYIIGAMRSETKSEEIRRWWFNREQRLISRQRK
jgi:hypothetical protein